MISRYSRQEMAELWAPHERLRRWRDVELAALEGMVEAKLAPPEALEECRRKVGDFGQAEVARIEEIEKTTRHDVIAFLTFLEERIGPSARFLHAGMTSSDVLDTALGTTLRDAADLILQGLERARTAVRTRAFEHQKTVMVGRSHGIHAEPTTLGLKLALWFDELGRHRERVARARESIAVGKISGAVGTFAHLPPTVERHACARLGLRPASASSQILQRDRHAEFFTALALLGASVEKFVVEIRHLQRTEVRELEEPFAEGQKGSSAMPHKRNPVLSENLTGLARLLRGYAVSAIENVALWHERDISHSSVERVIAPDATTVCDFMIHRFAGLVEQMRVYPGQMRRNLELLGGLVHSQQVLLALARRGVDRQAAYALVQRAAMRFYDEGLGLREALLADPEILKLLGPGEVDGCFDLAPHLAHVEEIFRRVFGP